MSEPDDTRHMAHALRLAAQGNGRAWPNPSVGCVIVRGGVVVGRGFTRPGGRPHAEAVALARAGAAARGATAYVTLEPCAHQGRGPPCADALVAAGLARVVTALTDPDPRTAGAGHARLRAAGIAVHEGVLADEAARVTAGFLKRVRRGLPFVTLKLATSLDGRIATQTGESRWITGPESRRMVHAMRLTHDAVLIGSGTARADDPELTVRGMGAMAQPVRVVIDTGLSLSPECRLGRSCDAGPVWLVHGPTAPLAARARWQERGAHLIEVPAPDGHVEVAGALRALAGAGLTRVLCEGGAVLAARLIGAGLIDEMAIFSAGLTIGAEGVPALGALRLDTLGEAPRLALHSCRRVGHDTLSLWTAAPIPGNR